ncbi:hypothetical protein [Sedimentitalea todarodis]|uniref:Lipid/polyisoprenoid-binding YceI-like domain-containing protein n=1 Tax=Sedimentitalea todarodis TaxID=1631240 RepID=A0ABU3VIQ5_9RHOB|nr:hypothetical protein [Sedimentitalea todarodis]MDU9006077.1 hypothetical protein [Sedimentitalea todarodis]
MNTRWGKKTHDAAERLACAVLCAVALLGVGTACAQVAVPADCKAIATVLKTSCYATTLFDCGESREAHTYHEGKLQVVHAFTPAWELTEFRQPGFSGMKMSAVPGTVANTNIAALLEAGWSQETGQFTLSTRMIENRPYVLTGRIELTEETVALGGIEFRKARMFRVFETDIGTGGMEFEIDIYLSPERDILFEADWSRSVFGSNQEHFAQTPFHLAWPGQPGFLSTKSGGKCNG